MIIIVKLIPTYNDGNDDYYYSIFITIAIIVPYIYIHDDIVIILITFMTIFAIIITINKFIIMIIDKLVSNHALKHLASRFRF